MVFENSFGELVDVLIGNDLDKSFGFTISDYIKIGDFLAQDVFDILMKEKPFLNNYDSIRVVGIIENSSSMTWNSSVYDQKYHLVHISCTYILYIQRYFGGWFRNY